MTKSKPSGRFAKYTKHFNALAKQKALLIDFNDNHAGDLAISSEKLENLSTSTNHVSHIEDAEIFVVWCGTVEKTVRYVLAFMNWRNHGRLWQSPTLENCMPDLRLHNQAFDYPYGEVGVYRVRVNLVDNWSLNKSLSLYDIYESAATKPDYILSSFEHIFGWASQKAKLIRSQNGITLPYAGCLGLVVVPGDGVGMYFYLFFQWLNITEEVRFFHSFDNDLSLSSWSAASLQGVPQKVS